MTKAFHQMTNRACDSGRPYELIAQKRAALPKDALDKLAKLALKKAAEKTRNAKPKVLVN